MHSVFYDDRVASLLRTPPAILFRAECHDEGSVACNSAFGDLGMVSRDPNMPEESKAFENCLSWTKINALSTFH
jgi:hypothetical protein